MLIFLSCLKGFAQSADRYEMCPEGEDSCGPQQYDSQRVTIIGQSLQQAPFSFILHQEIKRGGTNYSTGSFISPDMLITAHHNVFQPGFIRKLSFCNKSIDPQHWVTFKRKEVEIFTFSSAQAPTDIAIIKFKSPAKIRELYRGHFNVGSFGETGDSAVFHLAGFPCDRPDTLVEKSVTTHRIRLHENQTLIGYQMYTCTGDSGAPLWYSHENSPTIVGIHHGGCERNFSTDWNCSAQITSNVVAWIDRLRSNR